MTIPNHSVPHRDHTRGDQPEYTLSLYPDAVYSCKFFVFVRLFAICELCHSHFFAPPQGAISALAVDYLQVTTFKTSRAFGCEGFLPLTNAGGKSFIHVVILYTGICAQDTRVDGFAVRLSLT